MAIPQAKKGFTLVELVVVMAILATLVGLGLIAVNAARVQSRNTERRSNIKSFKVALESFHSAHRDYPNCTEISIYAPQCAGETRTPPYDAFIASGFTDPRGSSWNFNSCYSITSDDTYELRLQPETPYGAGRTPEIECDGMSSYPDVFDQL